MISTNGGLILVLVVGASTAQGPEEHQQRRNVQPQFYRHTAVSDYLLSKKEDTGLKNSPLVVAA